MNRGLALEKTGNHAAAIESYTRALSITKDDAWTLLHRGACRGAMGDLAGAEADIRRGLSLLGPADQRLKHFGLNQLGEAIRVALRDLILPEDANLTDIERLEQQLEVARRAFSQVIAEDPASAWAYAHRGAVTTLACWLAAKGKKAEQRKELSELARRDLEEAVHLRDGYAWAMVFQAFRLTLLGSIASDEAERRALFQEAQGRAEAAGKANPSLPTARAVSELALYRCDYDKVLEVAWPAVAKDPDDIVVRYCLAAALLGRDAVDGDPAVSEVRRETERACLEQARNTMFAKRTRASAMIGGLAMREGRYDEAAKMLGDVLDYPDMDTVTFISNDPAWDLARAAGNEPHLQRVREAYRRLFPEALRE